MKLNPTRIILLLAVPVLFYTACKKNTVKPATTTAVTDYKKLSSQVALTFYKSITGQYGGADVSKGITSPLSAKAAGHSVYSIAPLCGFAIDTSYNYSIRTGPPHALTDTQKTYGGTFLFQYTCTAGQVDGYDIHDSVTYQEGNGFTFINNTTVAQKYSVKALDQTYKLVSMDGSINSSTGFAQTFNESGSSLTASYVLTGLRVNFTSGTADVITGAATFHIIYYAQHSFDLPFKPAVYDGAIQFLGNHQAKLTINPGHVYSVDLITGVVTGG